MLSSIQALILLIFSVLQVFPLVPATRYYPQQKKYGLRVSHRFMHIIHRETVHKNISSGPRGPRDVLARAPGLLIKR